MKISKIFIKNFRLLKIFEVNVEENLSLVIGKNNTGETSFHKKVHKGKSQIRLKPANPEFDDIIIEPDEAEEVRILGKYVGHIN